MQGLRHWISLCEDAFIRYDPKQAYKNGDRAELKKAAGFYSEAEFIDRIAGRKQEPRTHYHGYDMDGRLVAAFSDPTRGNRYARTERRDPSRQAIAAYHKYLRFREQLHQLYTELKQQRADDFIQTHTFTPDEIEIKARPGGEYDAYVRGRLVGRAYLNLSAESGMPRDTRAIFNVAVFDANDRRQGVARKMYQRIEHDLAERDLRLVPSKVQYLDAVEFWKRYRDRRDLQ